MAKVNTYTCLDCGKEFEWEGYKPPGRRRCLECSIKRMTDSASQLQAKEGPFYEKWKKGLLAAARRL